MKAMKKTMWSKVAVMVIVLSMVSVPVFAASLPPPISAPLASRTILWPSYLVLYNDAGETVHDVCIYKLMYVDINGFFHWEKIGEVAQIALHTQAVVRVPGDAGLRVDYCVGQDGCSWWDRHSTGSFGPVKSGYFNVTLH